MGIFTQPSKSLKYSWWLSKWLHKFTEGSNNKHHKNIGTKRTIFFLFGPFSFYMNSLNGNSSGSFNFHINIFASFPCVLKGGLMRWNPLSIQRSPTGHNVICHHSIKINSNKNFQSWTIYILNTLYFFGERLRCL